MPIYVYEVIRKNGKPGAQFEIMQKISDPPLKKHPKTGKPVRRIIAPVHFNNNQYDKLVEKHLTKDQKNVVRRKICP